MVYILEVNPRGFRTVPFVSKAIGVSLARLATRVIMGERLKDLGFDQEMTTAHISVKESVFAVYGHKEAAKMAYFGLYALQHRGQESAGIVTSDGTGMCEHKSMGLVPEVFSEENLNQLKGHIALGHVRYSTTGSSLLINAQLFRVQYSGKPFAVAHNGNIMNARQIRSALENDGSIFQTTMDSEVVLHLIAKSFRLGLEQAMIQAMNQLRGAYSMVVMTQDGIIAAKDPNGFRPLCLACFDGNYPVPIDESSSKYCFE